MSKDKKYNIEEILTDVQDYMNGKYPEDSYECIIFMYGDYVFNIMSAKDILESDDYYEVVCHMSCLVKDGEPYMDRIDYIASNIENYSVGFINEKKAKLFLCEVGVNPEPHLLNAMLKMADWKDNYYRQKNKILSLFSF